MKETLEKLSKKLEKMKLGDKYDFSDEEIKILEVLEHVPEIMLIMVEINRLEKQYQKKIIKDVGSFLDKEIKEMKR